MNRHPAVRLLRNLAGIALVLLGVVGLVTPFLQGILLIVAGLSLIDLPIKHHAHKWLGHRSRLYRWLALGHHRVKRRILQANRRRRARRQARRAGTGSLPPLDPGKPPES